MHSRFLLKLLTASGFNLNLNDPFLYLSWTGLVSISPITLELIIAHIKSIFPHSSFNIKIISQYIHIVDLISLYYSYRCKWYKWNILHYYGSNTMLKVMETLVNNFSLLIKFWLMLSYLPLLPVLELLEGRAGVWELDTPADINETRNKTSMITSFSGYTLKLFNMYTVLKQGKKRKKKKKISVT